MTKAILIEYDSENVSMALALSSIEGFKVRKDTPEKEELSELIQILTSVICKISNTLIKE